LGKLRVLSGKQICDILTKNGFALVRQKGSHFVMQKREPDTTITVPVPNHAEIKKGTLLSIIRQSQMNKSLFEVD